MSTLKHYFLIAICLLFVIGTPSFAQRTKYGEFSIHKELNTVGYNFWLYTPNDYEPNGHPLPLVIFLHGASLCGNNIQKVRRYGVLDAIDKGKIIPTLVVAPQNPGGAWNAQKLNDLLEWTKRNYNVDDTRVVMAQWTSLELIQRR